MNQNSGTRHEDPQHADIDHTANALRPLRELQPSQSTRQNNAARVSAQLAKINRPPVIPDLPWWQRRLAVPVPVAAMVALALIILSILQVRESRSTDNGRTATAVGKRPSASHGAAPALPDLAQPEPASVACEPILYQEQTVIAGLGTIRSIQYYKCESEQQ